MRDLISVSFEHWQYTFPDDMLSRYGSSYYSEKEAGKQYAKSIYSGARGAAEHQLDFVVSQILCGNEAFPEAAVADPVGDLIIWDEWTSGIRDFPYPGRYSRLGITRQDTKISSPSSVGVLGEIMAGFFAQAGVSPWVLVRVVRRWPDFIFSHPADGWYSFVESKAFTSERSASQGLAARVPPVLLAEGAVNATRELTSDPRGKVWFAFTRICNVTPMHLDVTFLELTVSENKRKGHKGPTMPAAVADGLAERAVNQAAAQMEPAIAPPVLETQDNIIRYGFEELRRRSEIQIEDLLREAGTEESREKDRQQVQEAIHQVLERVAKKKRGMREEDEFKGRRLSAAKLAAADSRLSKLRDLGADGLYLADLTRRQQEAVRNSWCKDWTRANKPWGRIRETELWRCGGAVYCLERSDVHGVDISSAADA